MLARDGYKFHATIQITPLGVQARYWFTSNSTGLPEGDSEMKPFPNSDDAKRWINQEAISRGFDKVWWHEAS
jgi:hypothetical protein